MNRTYWALALGCNVVVLDSVYHALAQFLFESSAAYRLWKIVRIIDALTQKAGQLQETRIRVPRKSAATTAMLNVQNYQNVYLDWDSIVWSFPGDAAQLVLNYYNRTESRLVLHWREQYADQWAKIVLDGDGKNWLERLPIVLRELETP